MTTAYVHTDIAEKYILWRYDEENVGGAGLFLLTSILETEYNFSESKQAEADEKAIARVAEPLLRAYYGGAYDEESCLLAARMSNSPEEEKKWSRRFDKIQASWTAIDPLLSGVQELTELITEVGLKTITGKPSNILSDLEALVACLTLAKDRGAREVTIQIM